MEEGEHMQQQLDFSGEVLTLQEYLIPQVTSIHQNSVLFLVFVFIACMSAGPGDLTTLVLAQGIYCDI